MEDSSKKWLVKSGSYVYGPFDEGSIKEQLRDNTFTIRDQVIGSMQNWLEISDELNFSDIVEELRIASITQDLSEFSNTKTVPNIKIDLDSPDLLNEPQPETKIEEPKDLGTLTQVKKERSSSPYQTSKGYKVHQKPTGNKFIKGLVLICLPILLILGFKGIQVLKNKSKSVYIDVKPLSKLYKAGSYRDVISKVNKVELSSITSEEVVFLLSKSYLQLNEFEKVKSTLSAEREVPLNASVSNNILGLMYTKQKELQLAEKYFNNSIVSDENYLPPYLNLVVSSVNSEQIIKYIDRLNLKINDIKGDHEFLYIFVLGSLEAFKRSNNTKYLSQGLAAINANLNDDNLLYKEIMFMKLMLEGFFNKFQRVRLMNAISMLNFDLESMENALKTDSLISDVFSWNQLQKYCDDIPAESNQTSLKIILSFCSYKKNNNQKSIEQISNIKLKDHPVLLTLLSENYKKQRDNGLAEEWLTKSITSNEGLAKKYELPIIAKINQCIKNSNVDCIDQNLKQLKKINSKSHIYLFGEAFYYNAQKEFRRSAERLKQLEKSNINYLPALNLSKSLEKYVN